MSNHPTKAEVNDLIKRAIQQHEREVNIKGFFLAGTLLAGIFHAIWMLRVNG